MNDRNQPHDGVSNDAVPADAVGKKPYQSPELVRHGSLQELTLADLGGSNPDGPGYS